MVLMFSKLGGGDDGSNEESDDDDLMGGADDGLMGGDMMGEDDEEDSESELTYRLDEIEKEIDTLENRVETVRGENEKISDSISTVDKNVDKLVDLYEIVTEGINPFAADQEIGNAFDAAENGIFGTDEEIGDEIDDEIAAAEADDFLEGDIDDEDDGDSFEDEFDETVLADDDSLDATSDDPLDEGDPLAEDETGAEGAESADEASQSSQVEPNGLSAERSPSDPSLEEPIRGENGQAGDPPYLVTQPSRNDAELVTIEWLDFLVDTAGVTGAAQTIAYYEAVGWISEPVEAYLQSMLNGFGDDAAPATELESDPEPRSILTTDEHKRSLQYIAWIATPEQAPNLLTADEAC